VKPETYFATKRNWATGARSLEALASASVIEAFQQFKTEMSRALDMLDSKLGCGASLGSSDRSKPRLTCNRTESELSDASNSHRDEASARGFKP